MVFLVSTMHNFKHDGKYFESVLILSRCAYYAIAKVANLDSPKF